MGDDVPLVVDGLVKRRRRTTVLDDVSFTVGRGAVTALLGHNGSGKSTTLRLVAGVLRPDEGDVRIFGRPLAERRHPATVVGCLLDASALHPGRTVRETVRVLSPLVPAPRSRGDECLEMVGLSSVARRRVGALSLGMRQRLALALALLGAPGLLVLDEPTNGLDPEGRAWLRQLLREHRDAGGSVVLATHQLDDVEALADEVLVLEQGRLVRSGPPDRARARATVLVRSTDDDALARALATRGHVVVEEAGGLRVAAPAVEVSAVAAERGVLLAALVPVGGDRPEEHAWAR